MIKINVIVKDKTWLKFIKNPENYLKKKIKIIQGDNFFKKRKYRLSVLLSGTKEIKYLNKKFRKKNKPTDVLSFPNHDTKEIKKKIKLKKNIYGESIMIWHIIFAKEMVLRLEPFVIHIYLMMIVVLNTLIYSKIVS